MVAEPVVEPTFEETGGAPEDLLDRPDVVDLVVFSEDFPEEIDPVVAAVVVAIGTAAFEAYSSPYVC